MNECVNWQYFPYDAQFLQYTWDLPSTTTKKNIAQTKQKQQQQQRKFGSINGLAFTRISFVVSICLHARII